LNQRLGSLSAEGLTVPNQQMQTFSLFQGQTNYTLGVGGSFGTGARAMKVTAWKASYAGVLTSGGRALSMAEFGELAKQHNGETTPIPTIVGADTSYPLINVRVFPPVSATPGVIELAFWTPLTPFGSVTDTVSLPPGWDEVLHTDLAQALYSKYPKPSLRDVIWDAAKAAKQALLAQNAMSNPQPQPAAPQGQQ